MLKNKIKNYLKNTKETAIRKKEASEKHKKQLLVRKR